MMADEARQRCASPLAVDGDGGYRLRPPSSGSRSRRTGYRQRFVSLCIALFFVPLLAVADPLPLSRYVALLEAFRGAPLDVRAAEARGLIGREVESPNGPFLADASLLEGVASNSHDAGARLDAELAALRQLALAPATATPDPRAIEALRRDEAASALRRGGETGIVPAGNEDAMTRWVDEIASAIDWLGKKIDALGDWLMSWWPHESERTIKERRSPGVPFLIAALVIAIVGILTVLALEVMRRTRPAEREAVVASAPRTSKRDDDPLSRGANEWERYAAQLVAAGRIREAIRAWYHAVLVTLYAAGVLHFRKGRTNWEYIAALSPELSWRPLFVQLTGRFEQEWYGRDESAIDALDECSGRARRILSLIRRGEGA